MGGWRGLGHWRQRAGERERERGGGGERAATSLYYVKFEKSSLLSDCSVGFIAGFIAAAIAASAAPLEFDGKTVGF